MGIRDLSYAAVRKTDLPVRVPTRARAPCRTRRDDRVDPDTDGQAVPSPSAN
jgi:hypothetical protein